MRAILVLAAAWIAASPADAAQMCRFTHTDALRRNVVEPEIKRVAGAEAARYDATKVQIMQRERMIDPGKETILDNTPISIDVPEQRAFDGGDVIVQVEPCTSKLISSTAIGAFPQIGACPAGSNAPEGAWCVQDPKPGP